MSPSFENKNFEKNIISILCYFRNLVKISSDEEWEDYSGKKKAEEFMLLKNCIDQDASDEV